MELLGIIGGSGLDQWGSLENEIPGETPYGSASSPIAVYENGSVCMLFLPRHGQAHNIPPHRINYRANLWALKEAGVKRVLAVNAVGGITENHGPGSLALPAQLIDYTWGRTQSFSDDDKALLQHVEFAHPFAGKLQRTVIDSANAAGIDLVQGGCVAVTQGPRLETAAEIRRMGRDGGDVVGMTSMPEAALARELGLDYTCICVVSNWAAGVSDEPITMDSIHATLAGAIGKVREIIAGVCTRL